MQILLIILSTIAVIITLMLILALFVRKNYSVEREITVNQPSNTVFNYIKYLKNQDSFSKWATMDPHMKKEYRGTDGTPGFVSAWDSQDRNVGKGEQEILKVTEGQRLDFEIRFIRPFAGVSQAYMTTENAGVNLTLVKWGFSSKMKYPMNLMLLVMDMEKMIGNDFSTGLNNMKMIIEKK